MNMKKLISYLLGIYVISNVYSSTMTEDSHDNYKKTLDQVLLVEDNTSPDFWKWINKPEEVIITTYQGSQIYLHKRNYLLEKLNEIINHVFGDDWHANIKSACQKKYQNSLLSSNSFFVGSDRSISFTKIDELKLIIQKLHKLDEQLIKIDDELLETDIPRFLALNETGDGLITDNVFFKIKANMRLSRISSSVIEDKAIQLEKQLQEISAEKEKLASENKTLKTKMQEFDSRLTSIKSDLDHRVIQLEKQIQEISVEKERLTSENRILKTKTQELSQLSLNVNSIKLAETKLQEIEKQNIEIRTKNNELEKALEGLKISMQNKDLEITRLSSELNNIKPRFEALQLERNNLSNEVAKLSLSLDYKDKEYIKINSQVENQKEEKFFLTSDLDTIRTEKEQLSIKVASLDSSLASLKIQLEEKTKDAVSLKTQLDTVTREKDSLNSQFTQFTETTKVAAMFAIQKHQATLTAINATLTNAQAIANAPIYRIAPNPSRPVGVLMPAGAPAMIPHLQTKINSLIAEISSLQNNYGSGGQMIDFNTNVVQRLNATQRINGLAAIK